MRKLWFLISLLAVVIVTVAPRAALAHAALVESDPATNTVIAEPPTTARLRFTEPLEATYSRVVLASQDGPVSTDQSRVDPNDPYTLLLDLPALPEGQYVLQWRTLSQADGHTLQGAVPFAIGDPSAATAPVLLPPPPPDPLAAPPLADVLLRWLTLASFAIAVGTLVLALFVWQDRFADDEALDRFKRRIGGLVVTVTGVAVIAALGTLIAASIRAESNLLSFITASRVGAILALRLLLVAALLGIALLKPQHWNVWALGTGAGALLTLSLVSHSAVARDVSTVATLSTAIAITFDWTHLLATSAWIGALPALLPAALAVRRSQIGGRGTPGTLLVSRFTGVATAAIIVLAATGTFAALNHLGDFRELWTTTYGRALLIKLGLFGVLLLLGAYNRWWIEPFLASNSADVDAQATGLRHLRRSVAAEIGVSALLLVAVGVLTGSAPARDAGNGVADFAETVAINNAALSLQVVRGDIAGDTFAVDVRGLPADVEPTVVLRASMPTHEMGEQEITLEEIEPGRWGARSVLLTMSGAWNLETIVRATGINDLRHTFIVDTATQAEAARGSTAPVWALLLVSAAIVAALSQLPLSRPWQTRLQTGTLGLIAAAFVATTVPYYFARATEVANPLPQTAEVIAAGKTVYEQNCVGCHGVTGRGDGPAARSLPGLPGDFTQAHFATHTDAQIYEWIRSGKPGTAMPAFGERLNDEQIWQVMTYIRSIYENAQTAAR